MAPTGKSRRGPRAASPPALPGRGLPGRGTTDDELELGRISGVFGVRGEVRLHLHNREASFLLDGPADVVLVAPDGRRAAARLTCRPGAGKRILGRLDGLADRDVAAALKGTRIVVARQDLPDTGDGEFYVVDLQGLDVLVDGQRVGSVSDVHDTEAGDVLELTLGGEVHFVRFADPAVGAVDLEEGTLSLEPSALDELDDEDPR